MSHVRRLTRNGLTCIDSLYRRWHRLHAVGPMLFVGQTRYRGPSRCFPDGTRINDGDFIGTIHLNNAAIAGLSGQSPGAIGLRFARLLCLSLRALAASAEGTPECGQIAVFQGLGWLRHGARLGFITEPARSSWRNRFSGVYLRLLVWAFASADGAATRARPSPTVTWLTCRTLQQRFAAATRHA